MKRQKSVQRDFYCLRCGKATIPIMRHVGHSHQQGHRKKLWCPWCKTEMNCMEIRNYEELMDFKERFANGEFIEEAAESENYLREERNKWN